MTALPFTIRQPTTAAFASGAPLRVRRPADGMYARLVAGDRVWIREPYRLKRKFNSLSPTAASGYDARPYFEQDLGPGDVEALELGDMRHARCLLRDWHRWHAIVDEVKLQPLQEITLEEARGEGFTRVEGWAARWDADITSFTSIHDPRQWANNPQVIVLNLIPKLEPLPEEKALSAELKAQELA
ncbi:hypothetical protein [Qipengyuania sp.]|uniref:hypothetical protein n=1 Tax=Qipengyuania sp. TaxID=2004515 RepID=UPI0035154EF3